MGGENMPAANDRPAENGSTSDYIFEWHGENPLPYPPRRVISLVPSLTESLFDLDLGDRLIAVTEYCVRPESQVARLPTVGGTKNPDIARIIDLGPDLVLMNDEENRRQDADALADAGITVWATGPRTVRDAINVLWEILRVFDHPVMTPRVQAIERAADYTEAANRHQPVRVFVPIWRDPWMTFTQDTYMHDLLRVCGGENVFAGWADPAAPDSARQGRYPRIMLDDVVAQQPEVVLLPDEPYHFSDADAATFAALDIPAAHSGRISAVDGSLLTWHGTRLGYALRDLPPLLAPLD